MKLNAVIALALASVAATPTLASGDSFNSKLRWAADVGTHIYNVPNMESFKPSLELGLSAALPIKQFEVGTLAVEGGLAQTAIYGSSELTIPGSLQGYSLETSQVDFRRIFVALSFETNGKWFFKPQIGVENLVTKLRLFDPAAGVGFSNRETDNTFFGSLGVGYRFPGGQKGILSLATLGDESDNKDYRITYTATFK